MTDLNETDSNTNNDIDTDTKDDIANSINSDIDSSTANEDNTREIDTPVVTISKVSDNGQEDEIIVSGNDTTSDYGVNDVTEDIETRAVADVNQDAETYPVTDTETDPVTDTETDPVTDTETDPVAATETNPVTDTETDPVAATETNPVTDTETNPVAATETNPVTDTETDPVAATETDPVTDTETDPVTATETDPVTDTETDPVTATETDPVTATETEATEAKEKSSKSKDNTNSKNNHNHESASDVIYEGEIMVPMDIDVLIAGLIAKHNHYIDKYQSEFDTLDPVIGEIIPKLEAAKKSRDEINERIVVLKEKRRQLYHQAKGMRTEMYKLMDIDNDLKSVPIESKKIRDEIEELDWTLQTTQMSTSKERDIVKTIRILDAKLHTMDNDVDREAEVSAKISELKEILTATMGEANNTHDEIMRIADESQKFHEEYIKCNEVARGSGGRHKWLSARITSHREALLHWTERPAGGVAND